MKVNIKFIVITAVFVLFATGLGGGYYFFKEGKKIVADYSLGLSEKLLQTSKTPNKNFLAKISKIKKDKELQGIETEEVLVELEKLFLDKTFQNEILNALEKEDLKDQNIEFTKIKLVRDEVSKGDSSKAFQQLWGVLLKIAMLKRESGKFAFEFDKDYFSSLETHFN